MNLVQLEPREALNKAFLKINPNRVSILLFKLNLKRLLNFINEKETEEFQKNLVIDFLKETHHNTNYFARNNLVVRNLTDTKTPTGLIVEDTSPNNKTEMISMPNLNRKAFQGSILHYLWKNIRHKNTSLKQLFLTTFYQCFVFDAQQFNTLFAENKKFVKKLISFKNKSSYFIKTVFFCKQTDEPFIHNTSQTINFWNFDLCLYKKTLQNIISQDNQYLMALFKFLSLKHLLQLSFANNSSSFDRNFNPELFYLIGLTKTQERSRPNSPHGILKLAWVYKKHGIFMNFNYSLNE
jgi:adenine-specific DNA-methyltransferase